MDWNEGPAWAVIVQHLLHTQELCALLCVSKELRSLIHAKCQSQLHLCFTASSLEQQNRFAQWLASHNSLVASPLELTLCPLQPTFSASIAHHPIEHCNGEVPEGTGSPERQNSDHSSDTDTAVHHTAEANGVSCASSHQRAELLLQQQQHELQQQLAVASAAAIIQHIPHHITQLYIYCDLYQQIASNPAVVSAFEGLTALQHLNLDSSVTVCSAPMFKTLSGLSSLKTLVLNRVTSVSKSRHLPASLECLDMGICSPGLQLAHLTNLTCLRSRDRFLPIQPNGFLPPSLQQLTVGECHSVQRLVQLKKLRSIDMGASHIPARRLQRLAASLTMLTEVKLSYRSGFNEAAAAWSELPLKHLELDSETVGTDATGSTGSSSSSVISATTLQELGRLTQLTYLHIAHLDAVEATKQQLAEMMQGLTALKGLKLWASGPWPLLRDNAPQQQQQQQQQQHGQSTAASSSSTLAAAAAGADRPSSCGSIAVMHAIANLPEITNISLSLQNLGQAAAAELAEATKLTSLKLRACNVGDSTLEYLAENLTNLKSLFAEYNRDISDGVLLVLGRNLNHLTELDIRYTGVSETGRQYLRTLQKLKQLQV